MLWLFIWTNKQKKNTKRITRSENIAKLTGSHMLCDLMPSDDMHPTCSTLTTHYSNAAIFLTRFLFRFQLITFSSSSNAGFSQSHVKKEMAIAVAVMPTRWACKITTFERYFNLKKLSVEHVPFRVDYVILVFPADVVFATFHAQFIECIYRFLL